MKEKINLSIDATCDLNPEIIEKYNLHIVPFYFILGDTEVEDNCVDMKTQMIYDYVKKTGKLPKTSCPTVNSYTELFKRLTANGEKVIHFCISNEMSAAHQNACLAQKEFADRVAIINSLALSSGTALLALKAADMLKAGNSYEEIIKKMNELTKKVRTSFVIERVEYLHKGGRCGTIALLGANLFKIKPMVKMTDGKLGMYKKYRGHNKKVLPEYIEFLKEENPKFDRTRCFITHSSCEKEDVETAREKVKQVFGFSEIYETIAGSTITCHCGKGTLGVLFIAE